MLVLVRVGWVVLVFVAGVVVVAAEEVTPGRTAARPAAAMTLAVVADNATVRTRARPRSLAAISASTRLREPPRSELLVFMASRMANVVLAERWTTSEAAMNPDTVPA